MAVIQKPISEAKILIVDDLPSARKILTKLIKNCGIDSVLQAMNGTQALSVLQSEEIDIVISDWHMPEMDGLELMANMKEKENLQNIPFLMITSSVEEDEVKEALIAGVSDYICKPFTLGVLKEKLNRYFSQGS